MFRRQWAAAWRAASARAPPRRIYKPAVFATCCTAWLVALPRTLSHLLVTWRSPPLPRALPFRTHALLRFVFSPPRLRRISAAVDNDMKSAYRVKIVGGGGQNNNRMVCRIFACTIALFAGGGLPLLACATVAFLPRYALRHCALARQPTTSGGLGVGGHVFRAVFISS